MRAVEPAHEWGTQDYLLAETVNMLRLLVWMRTKDGQKGRNRPKMVESPRPRSQPKTHPEKRGLQADEYRRQLAKTRSKAEIDRL